MIIEKDGKTSAISSRFRETTSRNGASRLNSLLEDTLFTYVYDSNGNLTSKTEQSTGVVTTYAYDYENRLVSVTSAGLSAQYQYDPFGRRIQKTVNGVITSYAYDGPNMVTQFDGTGNVTAGYVHNLAIDDPLSVTQAGATYFYHKDSLGTTTDMTDTTGLTVQAYDYDSFGNIVGTSGSVAQPFAFTGREFDPETGLYFYRARYYDAQAGRFISRDPLGFAAGDVNTYRYANNNGINYIDALGLSWLIYTRSDGMVYVYPGNTNTQGPPQAFQMGNNTIRPQGNPYTQDSFGPLPDGTFPVGAYRRKGNDPNSAFGIGFFPIILPPAPPLSLDVQGPPSPARMGPGIHSGRANKGGPKAKTQGCARTTDAGMQTLINDLPTVITIQP